MNIIIFLVILTLLVLVHELGHFLVAKKFGVRVDEFGLGFPPRLWGKKFGETIYSLNILPIGGFVKIFGENAESLQNPDGTVEDESRSLANKNRVIQASVIAAGILFNVLFAWFIISFGLTVGMPTAASETDLPQMANPEIIISSIVAKSPAEKAGLKIGDVILSLQTSTRKIDAGLTPEAIAEFIGQSDKTLSISYKRGNRVADTSMAAETGIVFGKQAIGIGMDIVGTLKLPIYKALIEGGSRTVELFSLVAANIFYFLRDAATGHADLSQVAGPVGMMTLVGYARELGFPYLIFFTAFLSINLAVINLIPFPALDGGRLTMIAVETIKRSPLKPRLVQGLNTAGFVLLIILMLVVTFHDIVKLF